MVIWEFITPADLYSFEGDDFEIAAAANCALGQGKSTLVEIHPDGSEGRQCPSFLGGECDAWFLETFGKSFRDVLAYRAAEIATFLDTALIGQPGDRRDFKNSGLTWREWHEQRLTSTNDFGRGAKELAEALRNSL